MRHVILLHGLGRTPISMWGLARFLARNGYRTHLFGYASIFCSIEQSAARLSKFIERRIPANESVSFVGHSLGAIVVRRLLADGEPRPVARIVMLGPPNQGAQIAKALGRYGLCRTLLGPSFREVATVEIAASRACPEIGIVAGGRQDSRGYNHFLSGDNDGIVRVQETELEIAKERIVIRGLHSFLMDNPEARKLALEFLDRGSFSRLKSD